MAFVKEVVLKARSSAMASLGMMPKLNLTCELYRGCCKHDEVHMRRISATTCFRHECARMHRATVFVRVHVQMSGGANEQPIAAASA